MADLNANQQADQTAYPYPAGVMPPEHEQTDTTGTTTTAGTSTDTKALSPVQQAAEAQQDTVAKGQEAETGEVRAQKERDNAITADMARRAELAGEGFQNETEKAYAETQKMIDEQRARASVAQQRLGNAPPVSYFHSGDTWGNALRGFGLALGAVGDAKVVNAAVRTGHAPPTLDTVGNIVSADLDKQRKAVEQLKDNVVMARTGLDDAFKARQQMLQDIDLRGAAAYAQLERIGRARLAANGMSQPEIDQHQAILAIQEKRAEAHAKYVEPLYQQITKHIETAKRADQAVTNRTNAAAQMQAMQGQMAAPQLLENWKTITGYEPGFTEKFLPRAALDAEGQKFEDASNQMATALAIKEGGPRGASNPELIKSMKEQYIPSPSDTPDARAAKLGALRNKMGEMTMGVTGVPGSPPAAPAPAAPPPAAPRPAAPVAAAAPPVLDRPTLLRALAAKLQEARAKGDPRAAAIEARIREVVRGG